MVNFDALDANDITVELVTLSGRQKIEAEEGQTVKEFKEANGLNGTRIIDQNGAVLRDVDTISEGMQLFVSTPKKNG